MRASSTLSASAALVASLATSAQAVTCYSGVNVFAARGTGEQPPTGLGLSGVHVQAILAAIPDSNYTVIDYPATFGPTSVPIGVQNGTREITEYLDACPDSKIVVMGYSQGADVMGFVLTGGNFTVTPEGASESYTVEPLASKYGDQVVAVVFLGDPQFNVNIGVNSDAPYPCTVSSDSPRDPAVFAPYADRLEEWCNHDDLYCCSTGTSFLGHISYFSAANGTITGEFVAGKFGVPSDKSSSSSASISLSTPSLPSNPIMTMPPKSIGSWMSLPNGPMISYPQSALSVSADTTRLSHVSIPSSYSRASSYSRYGSASGTGKLPYATSKASSTATYTPIPAKGAASRLENPASMFMSLLSSLLFLL